MREIERISGENPRNKVAIPSLSSGVYLIKIIEDNGLVKRHVIKKIAID